MLKHPSAVERAAAESKVTRLVRLPEALSITALSRTEFYRRIEAGAFTPVPIGVRSIAFDERELQAWVEARIQAARARRYGGPVA